MSRIVWILVFLVAAVLFVKPLRDRVRPQIEFALNPIYEWEAKNQVNSISRLLERAQSEGDELPRPRDFHKFLTTKEGEDAALDPWGQPYLLHRQRRTFQVSSAGPDRTANTADDIIGARVAIPVDPRRR
jgi:hypothetical protein